MQVPAVESLAIRAGSGHTAISGTQSSVETAMALPDTSHSAASQTEPSAGPSRGRDLPGRYDAIRLTTEWLASPLSPEDCELQSMPDASPVKWHLAHTSWFFETFVLEPALAGYRRFDESYRVLFNSYYNLVGDQHPRPERGMIS